MRTCSTVVGISCASPGSSPFGVLCSHLQTHLVYEMLFHSHFALVKRAQGAAPRAASPRFPLTVQGMTQPVRRQEKSGLCLACVKSHCRAEKLRDAVAPQGLLSTKVRGKDKLFIPSRAQTWPFHDTWWQSQLLGAKPPVPSEHQMDARVPERAAITSSASLPLRESNAAPKCAMLQSRDCLRPHLSPPAAVTAWLPARAPRVSDTGWAGTKGQRAGMSRRQQGAGWGHSGTGEHEGCQLGSKAGGKEAAGHCGTGARDSRGTVKVRPCVQAAGDYLWGKMQPGVPHDCPC